MAYLDKDAILDSLTEDDVISIMADLGSPNHKRDRKGNLMFRTICHCGESHKLYYYHEGRVVNGKEQKGRSFYCYTRCGHMSLIELVIRAFKEQGRTVTYYNALKYIATMSNNVIYASDESIQMKKEKIDDFEWIRKFKKIKEQKQGVNSLHNFEPINEHILELFAYYPHETWLDDGITEEAMIEYEIGYYSFANAITIPFRDIEGNLIGVRGRFLDDEVVERGGKYMPLNIEGKFLSHDLGRSFYGLYNNQATIKRTKRAYIVESEKSVLLNSGYFPDNNECLAVCGSNLSPEQIYILRDVLKVEKVTIAFDKMYKAHDTFEAKAYYNKLLRLVRPLLDFATVSIVFDTKGLTEYKSAPLDYGKEVWLELLEDKITITKDDYKELDEGEE